MNNLSPEVIYLNGTIITMDEKKPKVEAIATLGDKIAAVGDAAAIKALAGMDTKIVDLAGNTMLPGFIEPHTHAFLYFDEIIRSVDVRSLPYGNIKTMDEMLDRLREKAAVTPKGECIQGYRYDDLGIEEKRHPTRYDLDQVSTEHPIYLAHRCGHVGTCNSKALELAGITKDTPDPTGGVYQRDPATGEPTGILDYIPAISTVRDKLVKQPTIEEQLEMLPGIFEHFIGAGVTSCHEAAILPPEWLTAAQKARQRGLMPVRMSMMMWESILEDNKYSFLTGFGDEWLRIGPIKGLVDGSVPGFTGWLTQPYYTPYNGNSEHCGKMNTTIEKLNEMVRKAHCAGYQVAVHAGGDAAIDAFIEAVRLAQKECPRPDARHRIEHCHVVREDQLEALAELGISVSFFIRHTHYWGDRYKKVILGPERAAKIDPMKTALEKGVKTTIHSDCPHVPISPLADIFAAVNRVTASGDEIGPEERVTPEQALRAVTIDAAWQGFEENIKGSIEVGKLADFVVLAENPTEVDSMHIKDIKVEKTIIGGKTVYQA